MLFSKEASATPTILTWPILHPLSGILAALYETNWEFGNLNKTEIIYNHRNYYYCYANAFTSLPLLGRKLLDAWYLEQKRVYRDKVFFENLFSLVCDD